MKWTHQIRPPALPYAYLARVLWRKWGFVRVEVLAPNGRDTSRHTLWKPSKHYLAEILSWAR